MARMTGKSLTLRTCPYGCCRLETGSDKTQARRIARRRERRAFRQEVVEYKLLRKDVA